MSERTVNEYFPEEVSPPGETLQETIEYHGMTQGQLAERMGRPKKTINEIIKGKAAITEDTAIQLERVLGVPASFWMNRERHYREALARRRERERLAEQIEWLKSIPLNEMIKKKWIRKYKDKVDQLVEVLGFYRIASPEQWGELESAYVTNFRFRQSKASNVDYPALISWLRRGEIVASQMRCESFDLAKFRGALAKIRALTEAMPDDFHVQIQNLCAQCGVAVIFVPELSKIATNGATRWLTSDKALIQLNLRGKRADIFWFTFFHEAGHIVLKHPKSDIFISTSKKDVGAIKDRRELEADRFAADFLIPPADFNRFTDQFEYASGTEREQLISSFAKEIRMAPGIVVGRLQNDKYLKWSEFNQLKMKLDWED